MGIFSLESVGDDLVLRNKYGIYSRNELESQLREGGLTVRHMSDAYRLKTYQMVHVLSCLGVTFRSPLNDSRVPCHEMSPSLKQVVLGTLLGDAYMKNPKSYGVGHSLKQAAYLYHVAARMGDFVSAVSFKFHKDGSRSLCFWTHRHTVFEPYFNCFYSQGKRKKNIRPPKDLGPEGLAYWYMDDGKWRPHGADLCVGKVTEEEREGLASLLRDNFGLDVTVQCQNLAKGHYSLYITAESRPRFFEVISPYIIPSMEYKIVGGGPGIVGHDPSMIAGLHDGLCRGVGHQVRFSGNPEVKARLSTFPDRRADYVDSIRKASEAGSLVSHTFFRREPSREQLEDCWRIGMTDEKVALKYGMGINRVGALRRSWGVKRRRARITPEQDRKLEDLFSGPTITAREVMKTTKLSFYTVKRWLKEKKGLA